MPLIPLGHSSIRVSPIGLGCWQFSKGKSLTGSYWATLSDEQTNAIVKVCLDRGINWFDTAEAYGWGQSEKSLSMALKNNGKSDGEIVIATKWFPIFRTARSIIRSIDQRLKHLDGFSIDLFQIHSPWGSFSSSRKQLDAMAKLVQTGKIRTAGVSNFNAAQMQSAFEYAEKKGFPLVSNQVHYSLLNRRIESNGVLQTAKELGMTIIAYSPLEQGILTGKFHNTPQLVGQLQGPRKRRRFFSPKGMTESAPLIGALQEIAPKYDATPAQIALRWLIQYHEGLVVAIPGATRVAQAEQNAGAMSFELEEKDLWEIERLSQIFR